MDNNLEFALAVAGASIGLAALFVFALVTIINTWRTFASASGTNREAQAALLTIQELSRRLAERPTAPVAPPPSEAAEEGARLSATELEAVVSGFSELRHQADDLIERQVRLQEAVRNLVESRALGGAESSDVLRELEATVKRLETTMGQMAAAVANLTQRVDRLTS